MSGWQSWQRARAHRARRDTTAGGPSPGDCDCDNDVENEQVLEATFVGGGCLLANKKMQKCTVSKKMKISTFSMCRRKEVMDFRMRRSTINLRTKVS